MATRNETHLTHLNLGSGNLSTSGTARLSTLQATSPALSHPVMGSVSVIETINLKQTYVNLATGNGQYTITGHASGDVLLNASYVRFSAGAVQTAGAATVTEASDTLVSFSGVVSTALGCLNWIDVSA